MQEVEIRDLQSMAYGECWDLQRSLFDALCRKKLDKSFSDDDPRGTILLVEHPAVYTLGKSGNEQNMLVTEEYLKGLGAEFYHIDRGGDITFHGPGQLVCYPIIDLDAIGLGIRRYIDALRMYALFCRLQILQIRLDMLIIRKRHANPLELSLLNTIFNLSS